MRAAEEEELEAPQVEGSETLGMTPDQIAAFEKKKKEEKLQRKREKAIMALRPPRKKVKLDYSYAEEWAKAFYKNKELIHLDISFADFDSTEIEIISKGLNENHSILGLHVDGNDCDIDAMGFLQAHDHLGLVNRGDVAKMAIWSRMPKDFQSGKAR